MSFPFLQGCFVIVDLNLCGDESGAEEDEILFFHPPGVSYDLKSQLYGWCAAMMTFSKAFSTHPLEVANLDKFKVSFKQVDESIAMILTGTSEQPDSTLLNHLNLLYSAFCFYNRSFTAVAERNKSRKDFRQKMAEIGKELVPLLTHNFHKNVLRTFNPIPFTPLIHKSNRHFIQASQLLNIVESEPGNISGCVLYKHSVICTHLDFTTTRFILNRLEYYKSSLYSMAPLYTGTPRGRMEPVCDFIPVYMLRDKVDELIKNRDNMFPFVHVQPPSTPPSSSPFAHHQYLHPTTATDDEENVNDGYVSLGLCIVSVHELAIAILMTFKAFSNKQHIKRSIWKIPADPHFQALESDLDADSSLPARSISTTNLGPLNNSASGSSSPTNSPTGGASDAMGLNTTPRSLPPLLFNARLLQPSNYHFLTYDSLTESASVTPMATPQELEFAQAISFMHHSFASDAATTEIIRKDSTGEIFGKQVFGREVYYQLKNGANISHDKFLEIIEKNVRSTLKDEHNINLI